MSLQYSTTHRTNNMSDLATQIGTSGVMKLFTGSPPANCGTADTGTLLTTFTLNSTAAGSASAGVFTFNGTTTASACTSGNPIGPSSPAANGTAGYFRIYPSGATTTNAVIQGLVGTSGSDLNLGSTTITVGVPVSITTFTITAFGA